MYWGTGLLRRHGNHPSRDLPSGKAGAVQALLVRTDVSWDPGPEDEPTLYQAMHLIARLGGYQDRKREPGTQTIWRGLQRIEDMAQVFGKLQALARGQKRPP